MVCDTSSFVFFYVKRRYFFHFTFAPAKRVNYSNLDVTVIRLRKTGSLRLTCDGEIDVIFSIHIIPNEAASIKERIVFFFFFVL